MSLQTLVDSHLGSVIVVSNNLLKSELLVLDLRKTLESSSIVFLHVIANVAIVVVDFGYNRVCHYPFAKVFLRLMSPHFSH